MRAVAVVSLVVLSTLPHGLNGQARPRTRPPQGTGATSRPGAASLPPAIAPVREVDRVAAVRRSRWSVDAYGLTGMIGVPSSADGMTGYTFVGVGTHGSYQFVDHFAATVDLTSAASGSPLQVNTAELGVRYAPASWDRRLRPYLDARASFMTLSDAYGPFGTPASRISRHSTGVGGLAALGAEYFLTNSLALTSQLAAVGSRLGVDRLSTVTDVGGWNSFWAPSLRLTLGLRYNRTQRVLP